MLKKKAAVVILWEKSAANCCKSQCSHASAMVSIFKCAFYASKMLFCFFCPCVPRHSGHINDGILQHLKNSKGFLEELIFSMVAVLRVVFSVGHNKPQSSPFIQIAKLARSPPEITRISVSAFADLNKSRQGHLIGVE